MENDVYVSHTIFFFFVLLSLFFLGHMFILFLFR